MDQVNLVYPAEQICTSPACRLLGVVWNLAVKYPLPIGIVAGIVVIGFLILYRWANRQPDEPTDEAPRLSGTARVLSFENTRTTTLSEAFWEGGQALPLCRIELEVHVPGHEPYVKVVNYTLGRAHRAALQPGKTVGVSVDSADLQNVDLDFNQPIT
jgi:hypothetical protein